MTDTPAQKSKIDVFLLVLLVLAVIGLFIDILSGYWPRILSTFFLALGLWSSLRWRRYASRRWRTIAWLSFALALAVLLFRLAGWTGVY